MLVFLLYRLVFAQCIDPPTFKFVALLLGADHLVFKGRKRPLPQRCPTPSSPLTDIKIIVKKTYKVALATLRDTGISELVSYLQAQGFF